MKKVYIVMKEKQSAVAVFQQYPHEAYTDKKKAEDRIDELNRRAKSNLYWVEEPSIPLIEGG